MSELENTSEETKKGITNLKGYSLDSGCKLMFIKVNEQNKTSIIPVLMLTGVTSSSSFSEDYGRIWEPQAEGFIGTVVSQFNEQTRTIDININKTIHGHETKVMPVTSNSQGDWLLISEEELNSNKYEIVYPRISINSLGLKTDSSSLSLQVLGHGENLEEDSVIELQPYKDYSILMRSLQDEYVLTLNNNILMKYLYNYYTFNDITKILVTNKGLRLNYILSNADLAVYLDALQIAKENSQPKISYNVKANYIDRDFINFLSNPLGRLVRINDSDLKFHNVRGYVSSINLDLDNPQQDSFDIKNYKTKFEDLFSTITAQTEAMKKNNYNLNLLSNTFTITGDISSEVLQSSIKKVDLNYAFNNGKLTIDEHNGIWGSNDNGVVAFRGGGIFTATEQNSDGTWKWNTGITPEGINADLITSGQLDTNLIRIYAGNHLSFQMNGDGIFAYKSWMNDIDNGGSQVLQQENESEILSAEDSLDPKQYVVFNDQGLSLVAQKGAKILAGDHYYTVLSNEAIWDSNNTELSNKENIKRVQISWDGLVLRNWQDEIVFKADPDTGNLYLKGRIEASSGSIGAWHLDNSKLWIDSRRDPTSNQLLSFVAINGGGAQDEVILQGDGTPYQREGQDLVVDTKSYCFWAGDPDPSMANFYIKKNGEIKANSGIIGGWTMQNGLFYNTGGIFLAPGGYNEDGNTEIYYVPDPDNPAAVHVINIQLTNYILWVPSVSWQSQANHTIESSVIKPAFAVTRKGDLIAKTINGCNDTWFAGSTVYSASGGSITLISPDGKFRTIGGI